MCVEVARVVDVARRYGYAGVPVSCVERLRCAGVVMVDGAYCAGPVPVCCSFAVPMLDDDRTIPQLRHLYCTGGPVRGGEGLEALAHLAISSSYSNHRDVHGGLEREMVS